MPGALVRSSSSTRTPRPTSRPAVRARSTSGRMPAAITTRSAGSSSPSASTTRSTRPSPAIASVRAFGAHGDPQVAQRALQQRRGGRVELLLHQPVDEVHDGRADRRARVSARAASSPSRPPPITTARSRVARGGQDRRACRRGVRKTCTPARSAPGTGGTNGREPVASDEVVVGAARSPSASSTSLAAGSISRTGDAEAQRHAALGEPLRMAQRELVLADVAGQRLGQQHAVVGRVGLGADDRDVPALGSRGRAAPRPSPSPPSRRRRRPAAGRWS